MVVVQQAFKGLRENAECARVTAESRHNDALAIGHEAAAANAMAARMDGGGGMQVACHFEILRAEALRFVAEDDRSDGDLGHNRPADVPGRHGVVISSDPDRGDFGRDVANDAEVGAADSLPGVTVVETVAKEDQLPGGGRDYDGLQLRQRLTCVIRRQVDAAPGETRALFEMEVGDEQCVQFGNKERTG